MWSPQNCSAKKSLLALAVQPINIWAFHDMRFLQICKILQVLFLILKNIDNNMVKYATISWNGNNGGYKL